MMPNYKKNLNIYTRKVPIAQTLTGGTKTKVATLKLSAGVYIVNAFFRYYTIGNCSLALHQDNIVIRQHTQFMNSTNGCDINIFTIIDSQNDFTLEMHASATAKSAVYEDYRFFKLEAIRIESKYKVQNKK